MGKQDCCWRMEGRDPSSLSQDSSSDQTLISVLEFEDEFMTLAENTSLIVLGILIWSGAKERMPFRKCCCTARTEAVCEIWGSLCAMGEKTATSWTLLISALSSYPCQNLFTKIVWKDLCH